MFCTRCGSTVDGSFCSRCGTPVAGAPQAPPPPAFTPGYPPPPPAYSAPVLRLDYATWGTRALGYIIDTLFVLVIFIPLLVVLGVMVGSGAIMHHATPFRTPFDSGGFCCLLALFPIAGLLVGLWNKVYLVSTRGASIGQGMMHLRVVNGQGQLVSMGTAALRLVAHSGMGFVPFLSFIDLLWPLWDDHRQTLHDKIANTYVINAPER
jgi:uncharacterized RDD family membrane protein YckC